MGKFADEEEKNNLFQNKGKRYVLQIVAEREMFVFEIYGAADSAAAARGGHFLVHVVITIFSSQTMSLIVEGFPTRRSSCSPREPSTSARYWSCSPKQDFVGPKVLSRESERLR